MSDRDGYGGGGGRYEDRGYGGRRAPYDDGGRRGGGGGGGRYDDGGRRGGGRGRGRGRGRGGFHMPEAPVNDPDFEANWNQKVANFDEMSLTQELVHGVYNYGFKNPSEIQQLSVEPVRRGRSVIAQAQSGTGKTGAFSIGILSRIIVEQKTTQALILAPTRELVDQIYTFFLEIGKYMIDAGLTIALLKGGINLQQNQRTAEEHPHICVASPGRALDLITSGHLRCENLHIVCLDEADQMLSEQFVETIQEIFSYFQPEIQILLFSATIPHPVFKLMQDFMRDPVKILVQTEKLTLEGIQQFYVDVGDPKHKFETLLDIYGALSIQKAVIFANSIPVVDYLHDQFIEANFAVSAIHGGLTQQDRDKVMQDFRLGKSRVLVSTDLLARGIDVQQITLVINFEIPINAEQYLHRIGRSGRYGRKGVAINICDTDDMAQVRLIEQFYQTTIRELPNNIASIMEDANASVQQEQNSPQ